MTSWAFMNSGDNASDIRQSDIVNLLEAEAATGQLRAQPTRLGGVEQG
eukprot:CAMPEP_0185925474 /NCGR_PEP_ID=MMETSP0924C-20121207/13792_1 /TAXON_ID=321610 /ORGANISM="Perkinsus chesapeaki, Strain ATCC PRA-65" /LENGTH=47 /DNA_ID= /DNA_START= /DNA_END= /DNA_ORIENTATION=